MADERCTELAAEQHGCISAEQARRCGLSADAIFRRARSGRWRRLLPGVYGVRGAPATWEQRLTAAASFDEVFHHCLHTRLTTWRALQELSERHSGPGCPGATRLREALVSYGGGGRAAGSPLEVRLVRKLARSGLPKPLRQHEVRVEGRRRYLDLAWPEARVAVEVDGYRWHSSRGAWERDRARLRGLRRAGWTILHATKQDVHEGFEGLLQELTSLLGRVRDA